MTLGGRVESLERPRLRGPASPPRRDLIPVRSSGGCEPQLRTAPNPITAGFRGGPQSALSSHPVRTANLGADWVDAA